MKIKLLLAIGFCTLMISSTDPKISLVYRSCVNEVAVYDLYDGPSGTGSLLCSCKGPCCKIETLNDGSRGAIIQISKNSKLAKTIKKLDPKFDLNSARVYPRKSNNLEQNQ